MGSGITPSYREIWPIDYVISALILSDNYYPHNPRTASDFVLEIRDQAILADHLGFTPRGLGSIISTAWG
jgi:hypothetical protein